MQTYRVCESLPSNGIDPDAALALMQKLHVGEGSWVQRNACLRQKHKALIQAICTDEHKLFLSKIFHQATGVNHLENPSEDIFSVLQLCLPRVTVSMRETLPLKS